MCPLFDTIERTTGSPIPRHKGNGNPKIFPEDQRGLKKPKGEFYTRTTTFISALSDGKTLEKWKLRTLMEGLHRRPDVMADYALIPDVFAQEGKAEVEKLVSRGLDAGDMELKANIGTEIHEASEKKDQGLEWERALSPDLVDDVIAYSQAMHEMDAKILSIEEFCVNDRFKIAGTFDRAVLVDGRVRVLDIKTGTVDYDRGKFSMQLYGYASMKRYDPYTYERTPLEYQGLPVDQEVGYIAHVPQGEGIARIIEVDLSRALEGMLLCQSVREWRSYWNRKGSWKEPLVEVAVR